MREAAKFYSGLPLGEADVVILFGWGRGYAGAALIERLKPDARVLVLEPDQDVFEIYRSDPAGIGLTDDRRFQFVVGDQIHQFLDDTSMTCQETDRFLWIDWPRAVQITGDLSQSLHAAFDAGLRDHTANLLTHFQNGSLYFENAAKNLCHAGDPVASVACLGNSVTSGWFRSRLGPHWSTISGTSGAWSPVLHPVGRHGTKAASGWKRDTRCCNHR